MMLDANFATYRPYPMTDETDGADNVTTFLTAYRIFQLLSIRNNKIAV